LKGKNLINAVATKLNATVDCIL